MVQTYENNILFGKVGTVVERKLAACSHSVPATVKPYHDRPFLPVVDTFCPDVEILAVIRLSAVIPLIKKSLAVVFPGLPRRLEALVSVVKGSLDAFPAVRILRGLEAFGFRIFDSLEGVDSILDVAGQGSIGCFHESVGAVADEAVVLDSAAAGHCLQECQCECN